MIKEEIGEEMTKGRGSKAGEANGQRKVGVGGKGREGGGPVESRRAELAAGTRRRPFISGISVHTSDPWLPSGPVPD